MALSYFPLPHRMLGGGPAAIRQADSEVAEEGPFGEVSVCRHQTLHCETSHDRLGLFMAMLCLTFGGPSTSLPETWLKLLSWAL